MRAPALLPARAPLTDRPRFDPGRSLGFRRGIPLEGLSSCYYRCVEAYVRASGVPPERLAMALVRPLDFRPAAAVTAPTAAERRWLARYEGTQILFYSREMFTDEDRFPAVRCRWIAPAPDELHALVRSVRDAGPVLLRPSPDHCLLAIDHDAGRVTVLDSELRQDSDFTRAVDVDDEFLSGILQAGIPAYVAGWEGDWDETFWATCAESASYLETDLPALREVTESWLADLSDARLKALREDILFTCGSALFLHERVAEADRAVCRLLPQSEIRKASRAARSAFSQLTRVERQGDRLGADERWTTCAAATRAVVGSLDALAEGMRRMVEARSGPGG